MSTIVFVLMVWSHGGYAIPTLEFSSLEKCNSALLEMERNVGKSGTFLTGIRGRCVKIEK